MVALLAAGLAIPVLATGIFSRRKKSTVFSGVVMAGIGIATGNPHFIGADLFAVGIGLWIALKFCRPQEAQKPAEKPQPHGLQSAADGKRSPAAFVAKDESRDDLTNEERGLITKYISFYEDLESGVREPRSDAQRHFLEVLRGKAPPRTDHEIAFLKHLKRRGHF